MITQDEINAVKLSATKKDFYQIWNELLDTAGKISERWDPTSTNESDPGIVLLKVLTAIADKLNYTIDANTLEAFMPSAAQEESMRKLCEMMGYNMKYYRSATTYARITYNGANKDTINGAVYIDRFTNLKDIDDNINYVTLEPIQLSADMSSKTVECMEGELVECETDNDNIISMLQLDDNFRYYFPETQIAENGIFITNLNDSIDSDDWQKVDSLNTQSVGAKVYKFGFDSREKLPYVQFPDDIATIIEDGLKIKYLRTNGVNGNISANTLCKMETPASWSYSTDTENEKDNYDYYNTDNYSITNTSASTGGANLESINDAYNNYKKTIGTFDTLVTCRDYMNKIYMLTMSDTDTSNLVSNIVVSDIRDDINKAYTLCTFNEHGIAYKNMARQVVITEGEIPGELTAADLGKVWKVDNGYKKCIYDGTGYILIDVSGKALDHFDLVFYPFKRVTGLNTKQEFTRSFKYEDEYLPEILDKIEENKTLAHNIIKPDKDDIACIKNYYKLKAKITTTKKVNSIEQADILGKVYSKLFETFNMRKMDFGEEIPYDTILFTIEDADPRIKSASVEEPELSTVFCTVAENEYALQDTTGVQTLADESKKYYNKLTLNNILAGRVELFNYDTNFKPEYQESAYKGGVYSPLYNANIAKLSSEFTIANGAKDIILNDNEAIQFRLPNLKTLTTYPAYVNYYIHLANATGDISAIPATMQTALRFMENGIDDPTDINGKKAAWDMKLYGNGSFTGLSAVVSISTCMANANVTENNFNTVLAAKKALFYVNGSSKYEYIAAYDPEIQTYYYFDIEAIISKFTNWVKTYNTCLVEDTAPVEYKKVGNLYIIQDQDLNVSVGKLVDADHYRYKTIGKVQTFTSPLTEIFIPRQWATLVSSSSAVVNDSTGLHTTDGLGRNAEYSGIKANSEYRLKEGDYLLINYTSSSSDDGNDTKTIINKIYSGDSDPVIIRPNFELIDSEKYRTLHNYTKTSGYNFVDYGKQPEGMFTLGTNEQIEIRGFIKVVLDDTVTNIYWQRNDEASLMQSNGKIVFEFDEEDGTAYTLKEGEYLYYTDINKTDIAYYGAGTKISKSAATQVIFKYAKDNAVSSDDIATYGLSAAIPWRAYDFSDTVSDKKLTITEYQYINLTKDAILNTVKSTSSGASDKATTIEVDIDNDFIPIAGATYTIGGTEQALPEVNLNGSSDTQIYWEVRGKLNFNVGPEKAQTLHRTENTQDTITIIFSDNSTPVKLTPNKVDDEFKPLSIKSNKIIQTSMSTIDVTTKTYNDDGTIADIIEDTQIKVFSLDDMVTSTGKIATLNNFGEYNQYTKLLFDDVTGATPKYLTLNTVISDPGFGLIMFYYIPGEDTADTNWIKITTSDNYLKKFNSGDALSTNIQLIPGINVIQIKQSCNLNIATLDISNKDDILIFSNIDVVNGLDNDALNPKLNYKGIGSNTAYEQVMSDINALGIGGQFYYNAPVTNTLGIDLNSADTDDTLDNPYCWFDPNNINNKFVIAEIDASTLADNVIIAKSSRSNY